MKIDAHQHFWNFQRVPYKWPTSQEKELYRNIEPDELAEILPTVNVDKTIIVQAFDSFEDTDYMLEIAGKYDWVAGVVGWLPLQNDKALQKGIEKYRANPFFKGVRHLIHNEEDSTWLTQPNTLNGLKRLAEEQIPFDVVAVEPIHLEQAIKVSEKIPNLKIVVDHLAKPKIAEKKWNPWATQMTELAANPNVYAKISGLNTAASFNWNAEDFQPYIDHVFKVFGSKRLMFGSDWPVLNLAGTYKQVIDATDHCILKYTMEQQKDIWHKTAISFYQLEGFD